MPIPFMPDPFIFCGTHICENFLWKKVMAHQAQWSRTGWYIICVDALNGYYEKVQRRHKNKKHKRVMSDTQICSLIKYIAVVAVHHVTAWSQCHCWLLTNLTVHTVGNNHKSHEICDKGTYFSSAAHRWYLSWRVKSFPLQSLLSKYRWKENKDKSVI